MTDNLAAEQIGIDLRRAAASPEYPGVSFRVALALIGSEGDELKTEISFVDGYPTQVRIEQSPVEGGSIANSDPDVHARMRIDIWDQFRFGSAGVREIFASGGHVIATLPLLLFLGGWFELPTTRALMIERAASTRRDA